MMCVPSFVAWTWNGHVIEFGGSSGRGQLGFFADFSTKKCAAWVPKG